MQNFPSQSIGSLWGGKENRNSSRLTTRGEVNKTKNKKRVRAGLFCQTHKYSVHHEPRRRGRSTGSVCEEKPEHSGKHPVPLTDMFRCSSLVRSCFVSPFQPPWQPARYRCPNQCLPAAEAQWIFKHVLAKTS